MDGEERAAPTESSSRIKTQRVFYTTPGRVVGNAEVILSPSALPRGPETGFEEVGRISNAKSAYREQSILPE
jgi:hypothetical protein